MRRLLPWILLPLLAACMPEPAPSSAGPAPAIGGAAAGPALPDDRDCNLSTVLDPDKPGSPGHLIVSPRNPNGDSELATLMRRFVDDLRDVRTLVEAGQPVKPLFPVHRTMRCAWPTRPEDRNEKFDERAQGYLAAVFAFDQKPGKDAYNAMIAGCIACHSQSCGGPLDFIDSMKWQ